MALLFDRKFFDPASVVPVVIAFVLLCLMSGAVYLMNDLRDVELDRAHPVKKLRPLAAGQIQPGTVRLLSLLLLAVALLGAWYLDPDLAAVSCAI